METAGREEYVIIEIPHSYGTAQHVARAGADFLSLCGLELLFTGRGDAATVDVRGAVSGIEMPLVALLWRVALAGN